MMFILVFLLLRLLQALASHSACNQPLISGTSYQVNDNQLSASSTYCCTKYGPASSRLNKPASTNHAGAWCSSPLNTAQWIQVDFGKRLVVTSVATQGRATTNEWVKSYYVQFSDDGSKWTTYREGSSYKTFSGNSDRTTVVKHQLVKPIEARYIRLNPRSWTWICLRWELYGCERACHDRALISGSTHRVSDSQLTASSEYGRGGSHGPARSRLTTRDESGLSGGWCPISRWGWIQVDLKKNMMVTSIATQGRNLNAPQWVTRYYMLYSLDGRTWTYYKEGGSSKLFVGNSNQDTIKKNTLTPFYARYVRLSTSSYSYWPCLRWEVYGCENGCNESPLINGPINYVSDTQLTASSEYGRGGSHGPARSRLNTPDSNGLSGGWCAISRSTSQWIQVDLKKNTLITSVATQGRNLRLSEWVTTYYLQYSVDGSTWTTYDGVSSKTFKGNTDRDTVQKNALQIPVSARYVRLNPRTWYNWVCLRWEVYGCYPVAAPRLTCHLPLISGSTYKVADSQLTASSTYPGADAWRSRLDSSKITSGYKCWGVSSNSNPWIQVDFRKRFLVSSIGTKACYGYSSYAVYSYMILYSDNGSTWTTYKDNGISKIFDGNGLGMYHDDLKENYVLHPFAARYVRLIPKTYGWMSLRWEIYGCPL